MGTRIKREGQIVEKQLPLSQLAEEQGQNTPTSPAGAEGLGATAKQQDMAGTPAQTQAQIQNVTRQRAPATLTQAERYEQAAPATQAMQQAKDVATTLQQLGPVQTRIQALIQDKLQAAQATTAQLGINTQAIQNIQDPTKRQQVEAALSTYLSSPTEANLQAIYDVMGSAALEDIGTYFTGTEEALKAALQPAISGDANLGTLDLTPLGTSLDELSSVLNIPAAELEMMTLDELNQEIDAVQAQELNRMEQLYATLSSPAATAQMRQAAMDELRQLGAAGIPGAEQAVVRLQDQINEAQVVNVAGREMSIEQALGDEGISALIARASYDDNVLSAMKKDPRYAQMAQWVQDNKLALQDLATEYEGEAQSFLDVQEEYQATKESLGEGGEDLLSIILDQELEGSVLSSEMEGIKASLEASDLYGVALENEMFREDLKGDPDVAKAMLDEGLTEEEILTSIDIKEAAEEDSLLAKFLGADGYITKKDQLAAGDDTAKDIYDRYLKIDPDVALMAKDIEGLTLSLLEDINASDDPEGIIQDIAEQQEWKKLWKSQGNTNEKAMDYVFGSSGWSAIDLKYALKNAPQDVVDTILAIFDQDAPGTPGHGEISQEEINNTDLTTKIPEVFGANDDLAKMIARDGTYDPEAALDRVMNKLNVSASGYEEPAQKALVSHYTKVASDLVPQITDAQNAVANFTGSEEYKPLFARYGTPGAIEAVRESSGEKLDEALGRGVFSGRALNVPLKPTTTAALEALKGLNTAAFPTMSNNDLSLIQNAIAQLEDEAAWTEMNQRSRDIVRGKIKALKELAAEGSQFNKWNTAKGELQRLSSAVSDLTSAQAEAIALAEGIYGMDEQQLYDQINLLGLEI